MESRHYNPHGPRLGLGEPDVVTKRGFFFSRLLSTRRRKVAAVAVVVVLIAAGVALAAWLVTGTGMGRAQAGHAGPIDVIPTTPAETCAPGGTCEWAATITNQGSIDLVLATVEPRTTAPFEPVDPQACPESAWSWAAGDSDGDGFGDPVSAGNIPLPAGAATEVHIPDVVALASNAPNSCQDEAVNVQSLAKAQTP